MSSLSISSRKLGSVVTLQAHCMVFEAAVAEEEVFVEQPLALTEPVK